MFCSFLFATSDECARVGVFRWAEFKLLQVALVVMVVGVGFVVAVVVDHIIKEITNIQILLATN